MKIAHEVYLGAVAGNFDIWREHYNVLDINDLIWLNTAIHHFYPKQAHYNFHQINILFNKLTSGIEFPRITEIGCHRGSLAEGMLASHTDIEIWVGMDINYHALSNSVVKDDNRYLAIKLTDWIYNTTKLISADIMFASHTFEHFNADQICRTLKWAYKSCIEFVIIEMPFSTTKWYKYRGSHIYEGSRDNLLTLAECGGYRLHSEQTKTIFSLRRVREWKRKKQGTIT